MTEQGKVRSGAMQGWIEKLNAAEEVWYDPPSGWQFGFPALWNRKEYPELEDFLKAKGYPENMIEAGVRYGRMWLPQQEEALNKLAEIHQEMGDY